MTFLLATGYKSLFHSYRIREARWPISTGAPLQFLWQEVTRSVATPPGRDASPLQVTPSNCQVALTNWPVPLTLLGGERHCKSKVSCMRTRHSNPSLGSIVDQLIQSPTDLPLGHQLLTPFPGYPLPTCLAKKVIVNSAHLWRHLKIIHEEFWFNTSTVGNLSSQI